MSWMTLPAPPNGDRDWSICTLAEHLCIAPAAVDARLAPGADESPDLLSARLGHSYSDRTGEDLGDCFIREDAADRIAAELPTGILARSIVQHSDPETPGVIGWDQVYALARHIVEMGSPASSRLLDGNQPQGDES